MSPKLTLEKLLATIGEHKSFAAIPKLHRNLIALGRHKKKIGYALWMELQGDLSVTITYHYTRIIQQSINGVVVVNNGGWYTPTTVRKINDFLNGLSDWRVGSNGCGGWAWHTWKEPAIRLMPTHMIPYRNGDIIINRDLFIPYNDDRLWYFMDSRLKEILSKSRTRNNIVKALSKTIDSDLLRGSVRRHRKEYALLPEYKLQRKPRVYTEPVACTRKVLA